MLRQSVPVIKNLIDSASNFDMALDLIKNTEELLDSKLSGLRAAQGYKNQLLDLNFQCRKNIESEGVKLADNYLS